MRAGGGGAPPEGSCGDYGDVDMFALGIDAYRMIPSLRRLMINPEETALHNTGLLSVDKTGRVKRSLLMATYEKGEAKLLQAPDTQNLAPGLPP